MFYKAIDESTKNDGVAAVCVFQTDKTFTGYAARKGVVEFVVQSPTEAKVRSMLKRAGYPSTKKMVPLVVEYVQVFKKV